MLPNSKYKRIMIYNKTGFDAGHLKNKTGFDACHLKYTSRKIYERDGVLTVHIIRVRSCFGTFLKNF